jgi:hypothetical protein
MKTPITYLLAALVCLAALVATSCSASGPTAGTSPTEVSTATTGSVVGDSGTGTSETTTDGETSISIEKVTTGSGSNTVTYYVADILLGSGSVLQAGLSGGEFGADAEDTSTIAEANGALLAINGDYYSARDDGVIIRNGVLYRDVPTRTGLAIYEDGTMKVYDEREISAEELLADGVWNTYSFGPALLDNGVAATNLDTAEAEENPEHPIQGSQPRTAIGMVSQNHLIFVVVDGRSKGYSRGVTLTELAQILKDLGCTTAYNLDGGGSSIMYYQGEIVNQPLGRGNERAVSDILYVG